MARLAGDHVPGTGRGSAKISAAVRTARFRTGPLAFLPVSERDAPTLFTDPRLYAGVNRFYDAIVRQPLTTDEVEIPVGIVSPTCTLLQH